MRRKQGQSTIEYALVLTAIILAIGVATQTVFKDAMTKLFADVKAKIEDASGRLAAQN